MRIHTIALLALATSLAAAAHAAPPKKLAAMTPAAVQARVAIAEDPLDFHTTISTEPVFRPGKAISKLVWDDSHVRAVIDKKSGAIRYEVHQLVRYPGPRRAYALVNYETPAGLQQIALSKAQHGADICPNEDFNGACMLTKELAFPIDEATLRGLAASYRPGAPDSWSFKFKDAKGKDLVGSLVPAEIAGLLQAVDGYRAGQGRKPI